MLIRLPPDKCLMMICGPCSRVGVISLPVDTGKGKGGLVFAICPVYTQDADCCILCSGVQCTVYTVQCKLYIAHSTVYNGTLFEKAEEVPW